MVLNGCLTVVLHDACSRKYRFLRKVTKQLACHFKLLYVSRSFDGILTRIVLKVQFRQSFKGNNYS